MKEEIDEKLEKLILSKSFEELKEEERVYVLNLISEKDYVLFSSFLNDVVNASQQKIKNTEVRTDVSKNLSKAFRKKHKKHRVKIGMQSLVITLAVAASLLLIFNVFKGEDSNISHKEAVDNIEKVHLDISVDEFVQSTQVDKTLAMMQDDDVTKELMTMDFSEYKEIEE